MTVISGAAMRTGPRPVSIVLIGAGSTVFTPGLLGDLAGSAVFDGATVHLVDIDAEAASVMAAVGRRIAGERRSGLQVIAHTDRREALPGADLVAVTIAVGAAAGWRQDLQIPERHGVRQTVGDSVGPGGVLRALRHVPELVAIARDVAELAPRAWLVNYSNPLTANLRAVIRETGVRAVGLCHGTMHTRAALARRVGLAPDSVAAVFAGLNHLCWLLDIRHDGRDLYPRIRELAEQRGSEAGAAEGGMGPVSADLLARFGRYPAPGDRHVAEFFADYLGGPAGPELPWDLQDGLDMTRDYIDGKSTLWDRLRSQAQGSAPLDIGRDQEAERLVSIAEALLLPRQQSELAVNLPNAGAVANLPDWAVVEVPAVIGAGGITAVPVGPLPEPIAAVLTDRAEQQELTVSAALSGDRRAAIAAMARDPLVPDEVTAVAILDDAIAAQSPMLDRFAA